MGLWLRDKIKRGWYKNKAFQMNLKDFWGNLVRYAKQPGFYVQLSQSI